MSTTAAEPPSASSSSSSSNAPSSGASSSVVASSSSSSSSASPLIDRVHSTNARLIEVLDQIAHPMSESRLPSVAPSSTSSSSAASSSSTTTAPASSPLHLIASCRPFDRAAFMTAVRTYSPLVWTLKPAPLDPLTLALHGWIASSRFDQRDTLECALCTSRLHCYFAPSILNSPTSAASLARRYFDELHHQRECPWLNETYDRNFMRLLPADVPHSSAVWIALNQSQRREASMSRVRITLTHEFVKRYEKELRKHQYESLPSLHTVLALCGWEVRDVDAMNGTSSHDAQSASSSSSTAPALLQCWFGCRDIPITAYTYIDEATSYGDNDEERKESHTEERDESKEAAEGDDDEEEERSIFQSPRKRRRIGANDFITSSSPNRRDSSSTASSVPIRCAPIGFDPIRCHRPFCPFLTPLPSPNTDTHASADSSTTSTPPPSTSSPLSQLDSDESPVGWQLLAEWWSQRQLASHAASLPPPSIDVAITIPSDDIALESSSTSSSSAASDATTKTTNRSATYGRVVATVHHLLSSALNATRKRVASQV